MNPDDFKHLTMTFAIIPTIRNGRYIIKDTYKYKSRTEQGRAVFPETPEPEITDCTEALSVIAKIKGGL
jgi:hypothetical protein